MRDGDWNEIVQHPNRRLTRGQIGLLREVNLAALTSERKAALVLRLLIEVDHLERNLAREQTMNEGLVDAGRAVVAERDALRAQTTTDRIWVSDDRCVLITMWASGKVTIAVRSDPGWTWGPPETLTEEKT